MESTRPGKKLGKYDRLALAECIDLVILGAKTIFYNGINQFNIQCEDREDANTLVCSQGLMRGGFRLFIPSSLIRKKAFTSPIDPKYSAAYIMDRIEPALGEVVVAVKRRMNEDGSASTKVEFTIAVARVPRSLRLQGYSYQLLFPGGRKCSGCMWLFRLGRRESCVGGLKARSRGSSGDRSIFPLSPSVTIDPSVGLYRIWGMIRSLSLQAVGGCTDQCFDPDLPAMRTLKGELVNPGIVPVSFPMLLGVDETDPMNGPFSRLEFSAAFGSAMLDRPLGLTL